MLIYVLLRRARLDVVDLKAVYAVARSALASASSVELSAVVRWASDLLPALHAAALLSDALLRASQQLRLADRRADGVLRHTGCEFRCKS